MAVKTFVTAQELSNSSRKYRKELLQMPVIAAQKDTLQYMTGYGDVYGELVLNDLDVDAEWAPYSSENWKDGNATINSRVLTTYLGNFAHNYDPNELYQTIYYDAKRSGKDLSHAEIVKMVSFALAAKAGEKLNENIWKAKRNPAGTKTSDLFDGLDTITTNEITGTKISEAAGNMINLPAITAVNAVDELNGIYLAADPHLQAMNTNMYMSYDIYNKYVKCFQDTRGQVVYNKGYEKRTLEVGDGRVTLVPMVSKSGSDFVHLAPKMNMIYGYHGSSDKEAFDIEQYHPWKATIKGATVFGTQIRSIDKRFLMVGKIGGKV